MHTTDHVQRHEEDRRAAALLGWAVASDSRLSDIGDPLSTFKQKGYAAYLPHAKAAVASVTTDDAAIALMPLASAFVGMVDRESLLGKIDAVRIPLAGTGRIMVGSVDASRVAEAEQKPVARITFTLPGDVQKVEAQIVVSSEALRVLGPAQDGITQVLASACAAATDTVLVTLLTAGTPASAATPDVLLGALGSPSRPVIIGGYDVLLAWDAGALRDLQALGVQVLASAGAAGVAIALDASGLLVSDEGARIDIARHASMVLDSGVPPPDTTLVSLWQANLVAVRCERFLRLSVRDTAVAFAQVAP